MSVEQQEVTQSNLLHRIGDLGATVGRQGPRRRSTKLALQIGVPALVLAALAYVVLRQWGSLPNYRWHFSAGWFIVAGFGFTFFMTASATVWLAIVRLMGERLGLVDGQAIFAKSLLARYVPGNMLLIVARVVGAERVGVSRKASLTSVIYELGINLCAAVAVGSYFLLTLPALHGNPLRWVIFAALPLTLIFLHPRVFRPVADWGLSKLGREPLPAVLAFRAVLAVLVAYGVTWIIMGFASYAFIRALYPLEISHLPAVTAGYALAWTFALITFISPSGLGTREGAYTLALQTVLPAPVAVAIAIGARLVQTAAELVYAATAMFLGRLGR